MEDVNNNDSESDDEHRSVKIKSNDVNKKVAYLESIFAKKVKVVKELGWSIGKTQTINNLGNQIRNRVEAKKIENDAGFVIKTSVTN